MYSASALNKSSCFVRSFSLQNFDTYKERESLCSRESVVTAEGTLVDYSDLELRRNPPNVEVDNKTHPSETIITIDSANKPGTLVEVVQCLTEINLMVRGAQISSDGGWFVDVFHVEEKMGGKVIDHKKLETIKQVLKIEYESERPTLNGRTHDDRWGVQTVLEMAGEDRMGLLHDAARIITNGGLDIKSLAAWTQSERGAVVIGAMTPDGPLKCSKRIELLKRDLWELFGGLGQVNIKNVKGYIHHERRLHRLLLQEAKQCGESFYNLNSSVLSTDQTYPLEVSITDWPRLKYWRVTILCRDRPKLLFDTLCTLADLDYEVYHATVVSNRQEETAFQDFYIRPRFGEIGFNTQKAKKLRHLLKSSILRRAPRGLKVHILTMDQSGLLCRISNVFKTGCLCVTRATVKCLTDDKGIPTRHAVHTFFLQGEHGVSAQAAEVAQLLTQNGGILTTHLTEDRIPTKMDSLQEHFAFNICGLAFRFNHSDSTTNLADSI